MIGQDAIAQRARLRVGHPPERFSDIDAFAWLKPTPRRSFSQAPSAPFF